MRFWFLCFIEVIFVGLETIELVNGGDCTAYERASTAVYGFSHRCSNFSRDADDKLRDVMPSGEQVSFKVTTYYIECAGYGCLQTYKACDHACPCCTPYMGRDPGFNPSIWAPDNETSIYMQNLNCIVPMYLPVYSGLYFFSCNFSGYGMANTSKLIQIQLSWRTMVQAFKPYTLGVYIIAGTLQLLNLVLLVLRSNEFNLSY